MENNENFLLADEQVVTTTSIHWIVFFTPLVLYASSIVLFLSYGPETTLLGFFLLIMATLWVGYALSRYLNVQLILTNQRLLLRTGTLKTYYVGYFLHDLVEIVAEQNIWGKWLGFGRIIVSLVSKKMYTLKPYKNVKTFVEQLQVQRAAWMQLVSGENQVQEASPATTTTAAMPASAQQQQQ